MEIQTYLCCYVKKCVMKNRFRHETIQMYVIFQTDPATEIVRVLKQVINKYTDSKSTTVQTFEVEKS